jgi:hypothetical protein
MSTSQPQNARAFSKRLWSTPLADGSIPFVRMQQLWDMAAGLPSKKVRVSDLNALDEVRWFSERMQKLPTCRAVAEHARNIYEVDFQYPIILSPSGEVLDGMHRLCKAFLQGLEEIDAVQLDAMPPYRWRLLSSGEEAEFAEDASAQS